MYVEGRLQTRKWQDKDGQDKYTTEIVANEMQMLGGRGGSAGEGGGFQSTAPMDPPAKSAGSKSAAAAPAAAGGPDINFDDDIPF